MTVTVDRQQVRGLRAPVRGLWWISPAGSMLVITIPVIFLAWQTSDFQFRAAWRTPKWLTDQSLLVFTAGVAAFVLGSAIALCWSRSRVDGSWPATSRHTQSRLAAAEPWLFWITLGGYVAFLVAAIARGLTAGMVIRILMTQSNNSGELKGSIFATIPGVTTLTQVGIAAVIVGTYLFLRTGQRRYAAHIGVVLALALARAYLLTERIALLEVAVPVMVIVLVAWRERARAGVRALTSALPLIAVPMLVVVFGLFEYSRSWTYYRNHTSATFWQFAMDRMVGYYLTALNNGQMSLDHGRYPGRLPAETLSMFWEAPVISQLHLYQRLSPSPLPDWSELLRLYTNPELTSACGICSPFIDWGTIGGLTWLLLAGAVVGIAYRSFGNGALGGMLVYPALVAGLFELPRLLTWTQGRTTPALLALLVTWWYARPREQAGRVRRSASPVRSGRGPGRSPDPTGSTVP